MHPGHPCGGIGAFGAWPSMVTFPRSPGSHRSDLEVQNLEVQNLEVQNLEVQNLEVQNKAPTLRCGFNGMRKYQLDTALLEC
ncbi:unnamed protein product [Lota lota]